MIRPLYRCKSLWLGLLMLVFLGWGWKRSVHYYDVASYGEASGGRGVSLSQRDSKVIVTWVPAKSPAAFAPRLRWFSVMMNERNHPIFPGIFSEDAALQHFPSSFQWFYLPYWFLMLLFLIPWAAFLAWRWRRVKQLTASSP
jgi:hypothetical protein